MPSFRRPKVNRAKPRRARSGCSGLGIAIFLLLGFGASVEVPIYIDSHGAATSGAITEKIETVSIEYTEWYRRFQITARYSIPGQRVPHYAGCDVDEKTYDSLHAGNPVVVHYLPNLLAQPFLPATHFQPCPTLASIVSSSPLLNRAGVALVGILALLFLWGVLRIRIALWLLVPWLGFCIASVALPRTEPQPVQPVPATATVAGIDTISTFEGLNNSRSLPLQHPYQIVRLKFVPPGMDGPVTAVDKVDAGSIPNLAPGQTVNIVYDAAHPRIVRLQQGTRLFPGQAARTLTIICAVFVALMVIWWLIVTFFRFWGRVRRV